MFHAQLSALMERTKCLAAPGAHQERLKLSRFESDKDWMISVWSAGEAHCSLEFYLLRFENTCTRCAWLQHLGIPPQWSRHAWRFAVHTPPFGTLDRASVATFTPQSRGCGWIFEPAVLGKPLVPRERHPWVPTPHWWMGLANGCGPTEQDLPSKVPRKGLALGNWDLKPQFSESLDQIRLKNALSAQFAPSALGRRHMLEPGCIRRGEAQGAEGSWPMASWGSSASSVFWVSWVLLEGWLPGRWQCLRLVPSNVTTMPWSTTRDVVHLKALWAKVYWGKNSCKVQRTTADNQAMPQLYWQWVLDIHLSQTKGPLLYILW